MIFDKKADLLCLQETSPNVHEWKPAMPLWVNVEHNNKNNIFSKVGMSAKTVIFTLMCTSSITLHNAILFNNRHYFITDINNDEPMHTIITTAAVTPITCVYQTTEETLDEYKRPIRKLQSTAQFPAVLTEKYTGYDQKTPMAQTENTYVLVTPKQNELSIGEVVHINNSPYVVHTKHILDEYKNEYEIYKKDDA